MKANILIATLAGFMAFTGFTVSKANKETRAALEDAAAYIELLESLTDEDTMLDVVCETDEFNEYYK